MDYKKIDGSTIERTKTDTTVSVDKFDYDFLVEQKKSIEVQRDAYVAARNVEIAEVDEMLTECGKLGITSKPKEIIEGG